MIAPASCMPSSCFCEAIRAEAPLQPANAWSSLAFCLVALAVLVTSYSDRSNPQRRSQNALTSTSKYPAMFAVSLVLIGAGSFAFHARLTLQTQFVDVFGMYLIATFVLVYSFVRTRPESGNAIIAGYIALNVFLASILCVAPELRRYVFAVVLLAGLLLEYRSRRKAQIDATSRYLSAAIALLAIGFAVWVADITHVLCSPTSWVQGHAVWHLLGATSSWYLFLYYRSERRTSRNVSKLSGGQQPQQSS